MKRAKVQDPAMQMRHSRTPVCVAADGSHVSIYSSDCKHKLYWRLHHCGDDARNLCPHHRYSRAHSLSKQSDLWCAICSYSSTAWKTAELAIMPAGELAFIKEFLQATGTDVQYCRQVVPGWWSWPVDFWNFEEDLYIQVDGHVHWYGMHGCDSKTVQQRDLEFNRLAYTNNARVVRVHIADVNSTAQLAAAIHAAKVGCRIVLTPSYASQKISPKGLDVKYPNAVCEILGIDHVNPDSNGNTLIP